MTTLTRFVHHNQRMLKKTLSYYIMHITVAIFGGLRGDRKPLGCINFKYA